MQNKHPTHQHAAPQLRIWDLPTRLFHWLLVLCVTGAIVTVNIGGAWMDWHVRFGIASFVLILFRIIWGIVGSRYARFTQFITSPTNTLAYLRGSQRKEAGHNPLGAWSVLAMLVLLLLQSTTGLFTSDDVLTQGPLAQFVSNDQVAWFTRIHSFNEYFIYAFIVLHLVAIAIYSLCGKGLVKPMISGDVPKHTLPAGTPSARDDWRVRLGALLLGILLALLAWWLLDLTFNAPMSFG